MTPELKESIERWDASPAGAVWDRLYDLGHRMPEQGATWTWNLLEKFDGDVDEVVDYIHDRMKEWTR